MPPKASAPVIHAAPSPSPPPQPGSGGNDAQDLLIIQDFMDTLDQIPSELTKVHSDLNELGAVLYSTLLNLETKLNTLVDWIQDATIGPEQRFQLLQEIAEEAARYKLGGDDKIRVAGGACDGIMAHQKHISNLLAASSLLERAPPSPYTQSLALTNIPVYSTSRRQARAANSPFGGRGYASASVAAAAGEPKDTPTKKKNRRVQQLGKEDDEVSSVGGEKKKAPVKKRKPANRAVSPADSLGSASAFTGKPVEPRTARQLAAAANKARKAERDDDGSDDSRDEPRKGGLPMQVTASQDSMLDRGAGGGGVGGVGLGLDVGSREGSHVGGRSANATPTLASASVLNDKGAGAGARGGRMRAGMKRPRADDEDEDESEPEDEDVKPPTKRNGGGKKTTANAANSNAQAQDLDVIDTDPMDGEVDSKVYCTCRQVSYGEMIGCDDDECEIEWYHLSCLGLPKPPEGNWICPQCAERRKKQPKGKRPTKGRGRGK